MLTLNTEFNMSAERKLLKELSILERFELEDYILFLDLMHSTNNWDLDKNIDDIFQKISNRQYFIDNFYSLNIQKLIIEKYHMLLLKKILIDYKNNDTKYLHTYKNLRNFPHLETTLRNYLIMNQLTTKIDLEEYDYNLEEIIKATEKILNKIYKNKNSNKCKFIRKRISLFNRFLPKIDKSTVIRDEISSIFANKLSKNSLKKVLKTIIFHNTKKSNINENETVKQPTSKEFYSYDLANNNHDNKIVNDCKLKDNNIELKRQIIKNKDISEQNLEGIDISNINFDKVVMYETNLKNTNANIDPQKIDLKMLSKCNLENLDLSTKNFDDVYLTGSNLKNTRARINPQTIKNKNLSNCILEGCYIINNFIGYSEKNMPNLNGAILVNNFDEIDKITENNIIDFNKYYTKQYEDNLVYIYNKKYDDNKNKTYKKKIS